MSNTLQKKKPSYPICEALVRYLDKHSRITDIPVLYDDLLRFSGYVPLYDKEEKDTLWIRVYYIDSERDEIDDALKMAYMALLSDGNQENTKHLNIEAVDYCTFGNSKPFRIKIKNVLNDNYVYFYVKKADASRVYGLELEHMLSPYNLNFLVYKSTLLEEHISGIPGDVFFDSYLKNCTESERSEIAKEFVKFNERSMIRLLGDMRSYNYVVIPTHDFEHVVFKIRAIDFDQQSYEGDVNIYIPFHYKDNKPFVNLVKEKLTRTSVNQYKIEERSMLAKRIYSFYDRLASLIRCMKVDRISTEENIEKLKMEIYKMAPDINFKRSQNMGDLLQAILGFVKRNYEDPSLKKGFY